MRLLVSAIIVLLITVSIAVIARNDPGYILISHGTFKLETTLTLAAITLALGFALLYYLIRLLVNAWDMPRRMRVWQRNRRMNRARTALTRGLIQLEEGEWQTAEQTLIKYADLGEPPLLHYLAAARAAQRLGAYERRDNYLRLAHQSTPGADIAVGLTQAELQLSHHQLEQALATLRHLRQLAPKHSYVLKLLMKLYSELHDWRALLELMPELRKRHIIDVAEADRLETHAYAEVITRAARTQDMQSLYDNWRRIPKRLRTADEILLSYTQQLRILGEELQCEAVIREALKNHWNESLIYQYGLIQGPDPAKQLAYAEDLLKQHPKNAVLLLTLGRLAARNRLWGKARTYLEASVGISARTETYQELGGLLEQMDEPEMAREYYRKGLLSVISSAALAAKWAKPGLQQPLIEALPNPHENKQT